MAYTETIIKSTHDYPFPGILGFLNLERSLTMVLDVTGWYLPVIRIT